MLHKQADLISVINHHPIHTILPPAPFLDQSEKMIRYEYNDLSLIFFKSF